VGGQWREALTFARSNVGGRWKRRRMPRHMRPSSANALAVSAGDANSMCAERSAGRTDAEMIGAPGAVDRPAARMARFSSRSSSGADAETGAPVIWRRRACRCGCMHGTHESTQKTDGE